MFDYIVKIIILLTIFGFIAYGIYWVISFLCAILELLGIKNTTKEPQKNNCDLKSAQYDAIKFLLQGLDGLYRNHDIVGTPIFLNTKREGDKHIITARTTIHKIDGVDAAVRATTLRSDIEKAKEEIARNRTDCNSTEVYRLQLSKADELVLSFYGVDHLQGSLWDIRDCEYAEGKHIEFEEFVYVYDAFHQSLEKTLDAISAFVKKTYPELQIQGKGNSMVINRIEKNAQYWNDVTFAQMVLKELETMERKHTPLNLCKSSREGLVEFRCIIFDIYPHYLKNYRTASNRQEKDIHMQECARNIFGKKDCLESINLELFIEQLQPYDNDWTQDSYNMKYEVVCPAQAWKNRDIFIADVMKQASKDAEPKTVMGQNVPNAIKIPLEIAVKCPQCQANLSFMGFKVEDLDENEKCPFCDAELKKENAISSGEITRIL